MLLRIIIPYPVKSVLKQGSNKHTQDFCGCFDDGLNPYRAHNTHAHLVRKPWNSLYLIAQNSVLFGCSVLTLLRYTAF